MRIDDVTIYQVFRAPHHYPESGTALFRFLEKVFALITGSFYHGFFRNIGIQLPTNTFVF